MRKSQIIDIVKRRYAAVQTITDTWTHAGKIKRPGVKPVYQHLRMLTPDQQAGVDGGKNIKRQQNAAPPKKIVPCRK